MNDYYAILGIKPESTGEEIKKAFRRRAKQLHPDTNIRKDEGAGMRLLIIAYETLMDPEKRERYNRIHKVIIDGFDYREFLRRRKNDPESQSKLIFFDLLHEKERDALSLYDTLAANYGFDLSDYLDREDFMDCAFLLAEEYEKNGDFSKAYNLLKTLVTYEYEKPYFRHFFQEITDRLRSLTCFKMPGHVPASEMLLCLNEMITLSVSRKDSAFYLKKIAEICLDMGLMEQATVYLERSIRLDRKISGIKKLKERIGADL
ncbi:MAG: J domain-containing protein [Spirochaetia bacterium]